MSLRDPFPDLEKAGFMALRGLVVMPTGGTLTTGPDFSTDDSAGLTGKNAHIAVVKRDDSDDTITMQAFLDIDVFAASRQVGYDVAEQVRGIMHSTRRLDGVVIDRVLTTSGPKQVPWDNSNVRRFSATYRISARRQ